MDTVAPKGKGIYPSGSPLKVIPQIERQRPHTPGDRSDEDREVETTFSVFPGHASHQVKRVLFDQFYSLFIYLTSLLIFQSTLLASFTLQY